MILGELPAAHPPMSIGTAALREVHIKLIELVNRYQLQPLELVNILATAQIDLARGLIRTGRMYQ